MAYDWNQQKQISNQQMSSGYTGLGFTSSWPVYGSIIIQCQHQWKDPEIYCPEVETRLLIQRCKLCNKCEIIDL